VPTTDVGVYAGVVALTYGAGELYATAELTGATELYGTGVLVHEVYTEVDTGLVMVHGQLVIVKVVASVTV
jgi:hypothetical protein